jgi:arginase family enzyme
MPLRMVIDSDSVDARHVALVGARNLDPPESAYVAEAGIRVGRAGVEALLERTRSIYVALDADALEPSEVASWMPEPGGLTVAEVEALFELLRTEADVVGAGITGLLPEEGNVPTLTRLLSALGL